MNFDIVDIKAKTVVGFRESEFFQCLYWKYLYSHTFPEPILFLVEVFDSAIFRNNKQVERSEKKLKRRL